MRQRSAGGSVVSAPAPYRRDCGHLCFLLCPYRRSQDTKIPLPSGRYPWAESGPYGPGEDGTGPVLWNRSCGFCISLHLTDLWALFRPDLYTNKHILPLPGRPPDSSPFFFHYSPHESLTSQSVARSA